MHSKKPHYVAIVWLRTAYLFDGCYLAHIPMSYRQHKVNKSRIQKHSYLKINFIFLIKKTRRTGGIIVLALQDAQTILKDRITRIDDINEA